MSERHALESQVRLIHSDLFTGVSGQIYDLIVSNPPYVGGTELAALPAEYQHEPKWRWREAVLMVLKL